MPKCDLKTRYIPATFAWTLLIVATTLFFYYPAQYYISDHPWVPAYQGVITFFVLANFTLATFMDPGVIPKAPPDEDREDDFRAPLYKNVDINGITVRMKWCVTCKFYRPPRCSHCSVCNHCIETFDHHCPWVNNCIGRRNYRFFFFFLISLSIHMISIFTLSLIFILKSGDDYTKPQPIISIVLIILVALLSIPIFGLTGFHMVLVSRGRTTNEQVTGKFKGGYNPFSRGCWDNCCYTQFGPQFPSLMKPHKYYTKRKHCPHGPIATITNDSQVKTYMDNSNGVRNINSNAYNKMSPGRDGCELDMEPSASQSQDCEPTPPLQRHGSKSNFFLPPAAGVGVAQGGGESPPRPRGGAGGQHYAPPRHSPHPRPRGIDPNRSSTPDSLGPPQRPSPTMQQRIKALGVPTPLALSSPVRRSNPSTPTQPRRPDFIGVVYAPNAAQGAAHYYDFQPAAPHHHHHQFHHHASQQQQRFQEQGAVSAAAHQRALMAEGQGAPLSTGWQHQVGGYGSPQRRFVSEGELEAAHQLSHPPPRSNNTVDNIRELANSPQRGVYMWKDASSPPGGGGGGYHPPPPPGDFHRSNPTSPTQQQQQVYVAAAAPQVRGYHPAGRGGVPVFPPQSPQVHRKAPAAGAPTVRRPMSFVRALEMSDTATQASDGPPAQASRGAGPLQQRAATPDRGSVYDMNYEISV